MFCFLFGMVLFPRPTLLIFWMLSALPANTTPFFLDVLLAIFMPRGLVAWWLYEAGAHPLLIVLLVWLELMEKLGSVRSSSQKRSSE